MMDLLDELTRIFESNQNYSQKRDEASLVIWQKLGLVHPAIAELERDNQRLREAALDDECASGEWVWADLGPTLAASPENPNIACFTLCWVPMRGSGGINPDQGVDDENS